MDSIVVERASRGFTGGQLTNSIWTFRPSADASDANGALNVIQDPRKLLHGEITDRIVRAYYDVFDALPYGLPESAYHRAMLVALRDLGINFETEVDLPVYFRDQLVGKYRADLIVEQKIIVENKTLPRIVEPNRIQLQGYLTIAKLQVGMLLNFGPEPEFERCLARGSRSGRPPSPQESKESKGS
ncbi:MAG: GxxExxY protein [Gemmatimonas sp.]